MTVRSEMPLAAQYLVRRARRSIETRVPTRTRRTFVVAMDSPFGCLVFASERRSIERSLPIEASVARERPELRIGPSRRARARSTSQPMRGPRATSAAPRSARRRSRRRRGSHQDPPQVGRGSAPASGQETAARSGLPCPLGGSVRGRCSSRSMRSLGTVHRSGPRAETSPSRSSSRNRRIRRARRKC
jgi:hypothetical protein